MTEKTELTEIGHALWLVILLLMVIIVALAPPVHAQNMTISRLGFGSEETVQIYDNGTTLIGTWNTSTNNIELPDRDFVLVIKPVASDPLSDPPTFLSSAFAYVSSNINYIIVMIFLIGLFWAGTRR